MAETKTQWTTADVDAFLAANPRAEDARTLKALMEDASGEPAAMWGRSIVGFGRYHYRYDSGHEGDAPRIGFSPRKDALTLYLSQCSPRRPDLLARLGKHKAGKSCVYVKSLDDIDMAVLREAIADSLADLERRYPD